MKAANDLHEALKKIFDNGSEVIPVTVTSVDKAACTCDVEYDGLELGEVRLKATNEDKQGFKIFPQVGSAVLIQKLGKTEEYFVAMYSEIDEVVIKNNDCQIQVTDKILLKKGNSQIEISDKVLLKIGNDSLKEVLTLMIEAIQKTVVLQGTSPDMAKLVQAQNKVNSMLQ